MTVNTEVTAADIARIAGVGRAAVSNWRRRHADFPAPIGGPPNSPTFALTDVEAWLDANGRVATSVNTATHTPSRDSEPAHAGLSGSMAALLPLMTRGTALDPGDIGPDAAFEPELRRTADAVVSITPVNDRPTEGMTWEYGQPSRNDFPLAWVQICLSYLKAGGVAVVAVPFAAAVRASGRRVRAELLRAGALTHVIGLPEKVVSTTAIPWQIWVLTRPAGKPTYVLRMVDLIDQSPDDLPQDEKTWATVFADTDRTRDIPSIELLDDDVLLVPAAHIVADVRDVAPDYAELRNHYAASVDRIPSVAPVFKPGDGTPVGSLVTVMDLVRSGALTFVDRGDARTGDVIVPSTPGGFEAYVLNETDETTEPEIKAQSVIRCDPDALDPHFLACFLRSETNRRQAAGTMGGTFRLDVRRARVPRMPRSEQRRYGEAFRRLMAFTDSANEVATTAADATRTAIYGLTNGVFAPTAKWPAAK